MKDENKTKAQLIAELKEIRKQLAEIGKNKSEIKKCEELFHPKVDLFISIAEKSEDVFYLYDKGYSKLYYVNPAFETICGKKISDIYKKPWLFVEAIHSDDKNYVLKRKQEILDTENFEQDTSTEYRIVSVNNEIYWIYDEMFPIYDANGKLSQIAGIARNITEQKRAKEILTANKEQYEKLFYSSQDAVMTLAPPTWQFTSGNRAVINMFNIKNEKEFILLNPADISPERQPDGRQSSVKAKEMIETAMVKGFNFFDWTHKKLTGEVFPATVLLTKVKLKNITFLQATIKDITKYKEEQEKLILFKNALESSFDAIGMSTPEGRHWYQNKAFDNLFGKIGENPPETAYADTKVGDKIFQTIMGGAHWNGEVEMYGKNKQILNIFLRAYSIKDKNGKVIGLVGAHTNITKQKNSEIALKVSEEKYRTLFESSRDAILLLDPEKGYVDCNPATLELFAIKTKEEILGINPIILSPKFQPDGSLSAEKAKTMIGNALKNGSYFFEWTHIRKDGEEFSATVQATKLQIGERFLIQGTIRDITKQKRAEEALRHSEERFRRLVKNLPSVMIYQVIVKPDGSRHFSYISENIKHINEVFAEEVLNDPNVLYSQVLKEQLPDLIKNENISIKKMTTFEHEVQMVLPSGKIKWFQLVSTPRKLPDGNVAWDGVEIDITDRKKIENNHKFLDVINKQIISSEKVEQMLRNVLNSILDIFNCDRAWLLYPCDPKSEFYEVPIMKTKTDWLAPEGLKLPINSDAAFVINTCLSIDGPVDFYSTKEPNLPKDIIEQHFVKSQLVMAINPKIDNKWMLGMHQCSYERNWTKDEQHLFLEIGRRITDSLNSLLFSRELQKVKNYLSNIINSMPSILIGVDKKGNVTQWNKEAENQTGIKAKDATGKTLVDIFPRMEKELGQIIESIQKREIKSDTKRSYLINGETQYEDITIYPLIANGVEGAVIRVDNVTEHVRLEEMMIQSEKMMSVGGLAAGMAHEINNPLAGIIQNIQVIRNRLNKSLPKNITTAKECDINLEALSCYMKKRELNRMMDAVTESGQRASQIVKNMLSFARKSEPHFTSHNLTKLLDKTLNLAENDYDLKKKFDFKHIKIIREYEPKLPKVYCESSKIQQVFLNILKNGAEAMYEQNIQQTAQGAKAKVSQFILRMAHKKEKNAVVIEIEDNGPGIPNNVRNHVFEPFYTTKAVDKGTGLGLSVSYFIIVDNHFGEMTIESEQGKGTKLIIQLPINRGG